MTSSDWYNIYEVEENIFVIEEPHHVQSFLVNSRSHSALIDTGTGFRNIRNAIKHLLRDQIIVLNTHWHFDHVGGNALFGNIGISEIEAPLIEQDLDNGLMMKIYVRPFMEQEVPFPDDFVPEKYEIKGSTASFFVKEGDSVDLGGRNLDVISIPGHTHGSMAFLDSHTHSLFGGDFIYMDELYAHLEDSNIDEYLDSLAKLKKRKHEFANIYPGHGEFPLSPAFIDTVMSGFEKIRNGVIPYQIVENMGTKAHLYQFNSFSVFLKAPGDTGAKII